MHGDFEINFDNFLGANSEHLHFPGSSFAENLGFCQGFRICLENWMLCKTSNFGIFSGISNLLTFANPDQFLQFSLFFKL